jgi:hypothetical protein
MSYDKNDPKLYKKLVTTNIIKPPKNLNHTNKEYNNKSVSNRLNDIYNSLVEQKLREKNKSQYGQQASTSSRAASSTSSRAASSTSSPAARTSSPDFHAEYSSLYGNPPLIWTHRDSSLSPTARRASSSATTTGYGLGLLPKNKGDLDIVPRKRHGGTTQKKRTSTTKSKSRK